MNKFIVCLCLLVLFLSVFAAFAAFGATGSNITMRLCVTGDPYFSNKNVKGSFHVTRGMPSNYGIGVINLGNTLRSCRESTH